MEEKSKGEGRKAKVKIAPAIHPPGAQLHLPLEAKECASSALSISPFDLLVIPTRPRVGRAFTAFRKLGELLARQTKAGRSNPNRSAAA